MLSYNNTTRPRASAWLRRLRALRSGVTGMNAAGDRLLDASGNVILDAAGNMKLDDGTGNTCCCGSGGGTGGVCGCNLPFDLSTTTWLLTITGATKCYTCCNFTDSSGNPGSQSINADFNGTFCMAQDSVGTCSAGGPFVCAWTASKSAVNITTCNQADCGGSCSTLCIGFTYCLTVFQDSGGVWQAKLIVFSCFQAGTLFLGQVPLACDTITIPNTISCGGTACDGTTYSSSVAGGTAILTLNGC